MKKLWITIVACVAAGAVLMAAGGVMGAKRHMYIDRTGIHVQDWKSAERTTVDEPDIPAFENIDISVFSFDIEFVRGESYGISIASAEGQEISWSNENGTLTVTEPSAASFPFFNFNLDWFSWFNYTSLIRVCIPEGAELDSVKIKSSSGNVTVPQLNCQRLDLNSSLGDMRLGNLMAKAVTVNSSSGNFSLDTAAFDTLSLTASLGDVKLNNITAKDITAKLSSGNFRVNTASFDTLDVNTSLGDVTLTGLDGLKCKADSSSGNIKITGNIQSAIEAGASLGDININLAGKSEDYSKTLSTSLGDIWLDGSRLGGLNETGGEKTLTARTKSGNIRVGFAQ